MTGAPSMMLIQQEIKKVSDSLKTDLTFKYLVYFRLCATNLSTAEAIGLNAI